MTDEEEFDSERYESDVDDDEKMFESDAGKRAYHNLLERKRRDNIKDSFCQLRDAIPSFSKKKKVRASRVQILKKSCDFIKRQPDLQIMQDQMSDMEDENKLLEKMLEELDTAIENSDTETIARIQAMNPLKRRSCLLETEDSDSDDCDSSDDECGSSPPQSSPAAEVLPRKKIKKSP